MQTAFAEAFLWALGFSPAEGVGIGLASRFTDKQRWTWQFGVPLVHGPLSRPAGDRTEQMGAGEECRRSRKDDREHRRKRMDI